MCKTAIVDNHSNHHETAGEYFDNEPVKYDVDSIITNLVLSADTPDEIGIESGNDREQTLRVEPEEEDGNGRTLVEGTVKCMKQSHACIGATNVSQI